MYLAEAWQLVGNSEREQHGGQREDEMAIGDGGSWQRTRRSKTWKIRRLRRR